MTDIEVRELESSEYKLWDDLVENSQYGTVFHKSNWLAICGDVLNKNLKIYGCFQNDELVGGCSLLLIKIAGIFKVASSTCEMTPYGGIIIKEPLSTNVKKQVSESNKKMNSLREFLLDHKFDSIDIIFSPGFLDIRPFTWNGWNSKVLYAYYIDLEYEIETNISKNACRSIKKAIENGIIIEKLNNSNLFNELFSMTYRRQGLNPPVAENFFEKVINLLTINSIGEMWIAKKSSGEVISAEIIVHENFRKNKRAYRWAAATHTDYKDLGATYLILSKIFQDLKDEDFRGINLMAANTPHLTRFISQFNPTLIPYYGIEKSNSIFKIFRDTYFFYKNLRNSF